MSGIKILIVTHKPVKLLKGDIFCTVHAGRAIATKRTKDGKINKNDYKWLLENTVGDDTGENISAKNRYYSECSVLYWAWKNYEKIDNPDHIGLMHYRRHFIFNEEYYQNKKKTKWEKALGYIKEPFITDKYTEKIGLKESVIKNIYKNYDLIVSKDSNLNLIHGRNLREDYKNTIPGVKVKDFDLMIEIIKEKYPEYTEVIKKNINGYKKSMYQMFVMKRELFFEYCNFLFDILFELEKRINFEKYTINGKRSLGYLAELILTIYVWKKEEENKKILKLGVTMVEYPYQKEEINNILKRGCPKASEYFKYKILSFLAKGELKISRKEIAHNIRRKRESFKKLKKYIKEGIING